MAIRIAYLMYAAAICALLLLVTIRSASVFVTAAAGAVLALWFVSLVVLFFRRRWAYWGCLAAFVPIAAVLISQSIRRIAFVLEHGGMDCPTCDASPLAFFLGWATELVILLPGLAFCWWLWRSMRRESAAT